MKNKYELQIEKVEKLEEELNIARSKVEEMRPLQLEADFDLLKEHDLTVYEVNWFDETSDIVTRISNFEGSYILSEDVVKVIRKLAHDYKKLEDEVLMWSQGG